MSLFITTSETVRTLAEPLLESESCRETILNSFCRCTDNNIFRFLDQYDSPYLITEQCIEHHSYLFHLDDR